MDWGHWENYTGISDDEIDLNDYSGFIYRITFKDGRTYYGRKALWFKKRRPPLKGYKRVRIDWVESDWRSYGSSSPTVADRLSSDAECVDQYQLLALLSSKSTIALGEALAIGLSRLYSVNTAPLNERIEQVRGGYKATAGDQEQLDRLVKSIIVYHELEEVYIEDTSSNTGHTNQTGC